jgi:hypothetical protein
MVWGIAIGAATGIALAAAILFVISEQFDMQLVEY